VAANSSIADGVASALKPRRTSIDPYPAATARANTISEATFQGFVSSLLCQAGTTYQGLKFRSMMSDLAAIQKA
jgi:hypothetical protein